MPFSVVINVPSCEPSLLQRTVVRHALRQPAQSRRLRQHTGVRPRVPVPQAVRDLRPLPEQIHPAGRVARLRAQHPVQLTRVLPARVSHRLLHRAARSAQRDVTPH